MKSVKQKTCKAESCGNKFTPFNSTQVVCSTKCAVELGKKKAKDKEEKQFRKGQREAKEKLKTYNQKMSELQVVFNRMRRLEELAWFKERGIEPYCISCLNPIGNDQWCCGHLKTTKARPDVRFDRKNTFLQHNVRCNQHLSGDIENYKKGLVYRFGESDAIGIINYLETEKNIVKIDDTEISNLKKKWNEKIRALRSEIQL